MGEERDMTALAEEIKNERWRREKRKSVTKLGKNVRTKNVAKRVTAEATKRGDERDRARKEEEKRESNKVCEKGKGERKKESERETKTEGGSEVTRGSRRCSYSG